MNSTDNSKKHKTFTTEKGTELPLLNLQGKDYLQVAHRVLWFREKCPLWAIETLVIPMPDDAPLVRAVIKDETGRVIATAHKHAIKVTKMGSPIEHAETAAIGRALSLVGYGTAMAHDLEEGESVCDSPVVRSKPPIAAVPEALNTKLDTTQNISITDYEITIMWAVAKENNWKSLDIESYLRKSGINVAHPKELTIVQYSALITTMKKFPKEKK